MVVKVKTDVGVSGPVRALLELGMWIGLGMVLGSGIGIRVRSGDSIRCVGVGVG